VVDCCVCFFIVFSIVYFVLGSEQIDFVPSKAVQLPFSFPSTVTAFTLSGMADRHCWTG